MVEATGTTDAARAGAMTLRRGTEADAPAVCALLATQLLRDPDLNLVAQRLSDAPSALAFDGDALVGFAYCGAWAPDIMELLNILVADTHRSRGLGSRLLGVVEGEMPSGVRGILLENSDLHGTALGGKRPATSFYLANGYSAIADTGATRVFWKGLGA